MDAFDAASVQRDSKGNVYQLNHLEAPYRAGSRPADGVVEAAAAAPETPRSLADRYLQDALPHMGLSENLLAPQGVALEGANAREQLVYHDEKEIMGNATVTYDQTIEGIPVWESGMAVQIEVAPMQVIGSQCSVKRDIGIQLPPNDAPYRQINLIPQTLRKLLGIGQPLVIEVNNSKQFIYQYIQAKRLEIHVAGPTGQGELLTPFALPPVNNEIVDGRAYVVTAVQFTVGSKETGLAGWLALIEPNTGSVLLLRSLVGCVCTCTLNDAAAETPPAQATNGAATGVTNGRPSVVFFDIGDTLGSAVINGSGDLVRIDIFPAA